MKGTIENLNSQIRKRIIGLAIVFLLFCAFIFVIQFKVLSSYSLRVFKSFTAETPAFFLPQRLSEGNFRTLQTRINDFSNEDQGNVDTTLTLTIDEVNALIYSDLELRSRLHVVRISPANMTVLVSFPFVTQSTLRYLNGVATVRLFFDLGYPRFYIDSLHVKGQPLPEKYIGSLKDANLIVRSLFFPRVFVASDYSEFHKFFWRIKDIRLDDGKIVLHRF